MAGAGVGVSTYANLMVVDVLGQELKITTQLQLLMMDHVYYLQVRIVRTMEMTS